MYYFILPDSVLIAEMGALEWGVHRAGTQTQLFLTPEFSSYSCTERGEGRLGQESQQTAWRTSIDWKRRLWAMPSACSLFKAVILPVWAERLWSLFERSSKGSERPAYLWLKKHRPISLKKAVLFHPAHGFEKYAYRMLRKRQGPITLWNQWSRRRPADPTLLPKDSRVLLCGAQRWSDRQEDGEFAGQWLSAPMTGF